MIGCHSQSDFMEQRPNQGRRPMPHLEFDDNRRWIIARPSPAPLMGIKMCLHIPTYHQLSTHQPFLLSGDPRRITSRFAVADTGSSVDICMPSLVESLGLHRSSLFPAKVFCVFTLDHWINQS